MSGVTLDSGALIAVERDRRPVEVLIRRAVARGERIAVPAAVVAEVWRDGRRQARLARLLADDAVDVVALDGHSARAAGQLCGVSGTRDVVDASVAWCARQRGDVVLTSDPDDLRRLDARLRIVAV